ncbi:hypothetical protein TNCV_2738111 [Trichonephila clavipes]|nr:hypothetical protein TNCV_2738111 [Trichonephila clavipes]
MYGGCGVLVWEASCLVVVQTFTSSTQRRYGSEFLFMDDNAPCHRTVAAEQLLESRRLAARTLPPITIRELRIGAARRMGSNASTTH